MIHNEIRRNSSRRFATRGNPKCRKTVVVVQKLCWQMPICFFDGGFTLHFLCCEICRCLKCLHVPERAVAFLWHWRVVFVPIFCTFMQTCLTL